MNKLLKKIQKRTCLIYQTNVSSNIQTKKEELAMIIRNCQTILNELSSIEEEIIKLERFIKNQSMDINIDTILNGAYKNFKSEDTKK